MMKWAEKDLHCFSSTELILINNEIINTYGLMETSIVLNV